MFYKVVCCAFDVCGKGLVCMRNTVTESCVCFSVFSCMTFSVCSCMTFDLYFDCLEGLVYSTDVGKRGNTWVIEPAESPTLLANQSKWIHEKCWLTLSLIWTLLKTKEDIAQYEQCLFLPQCFPLLVIGYPLNYRDFLFF